MPYRSIVLAGVLLLAGCECTLRRDVQIDRRCPEARCESESKCKCPAAERCEAEKR